MLQRLRDEAHRFAVTYHRATHKDNNLKSILKEIDGVGEQKRKSLMNAFGTVENIKRADKEQLTAVDGIGEGLADKIKEFFENEKK